MFDPIVKIVWWLVAGAFTIGAWVASIQLTQIGQSRAAQKLEVEVQEIRTIQNEDQKKVIDFMGRIDERLKGIERKL